MESVGRDMVMSVNESRRAGYNRTRAAVAVLNCSRKHNPKYDDVQKHGQNLAAWLGRNHRGRITQLSLRETIAVSEILQGVVAPANRRIASLLSLNCKVSWLSIKMESAYPSLESIATGLKTFVRFFMPDCELTNQSSRFPWSEIGRIAESFNVSRTEMLGVIMVGQAAEFELKPMLSGLRFRSSVLLEQLVDCYKRRHRAQEQLWCFSNSAQRRIGRRILVRHGV